MNPRRYCDTQLWALSLTPWPPSVCSPGRLCQHPLGTESSPGPRSLSRPVLALGVCFSLSCLGLPSEPVCALHLPLARTGHQLRSFQLQTLPPPGWPLSVSRSAQTPPGHTPHFRTCDKVTKFEKDAGGSRLGKRDGKRCTSHLLGFQANWVKMEMRNVI